MWGLSRLSGEMQRIVADLTFEDAAPGALVRECIGEGDSG